MKDLKSSTSTVKWFRDICNGLYVVNLSLNYKQTNIEHQNNNNNCDSQRIYRDKVVILSVSFNFLNMMDVMHLNTVEKEIYSELLNKLSFMSSKRHSDQASVSPYCRLFCPLPKIVLRTGFATKGPSIIVTVYLGYCAYLSFGYLCVRNRLVKIGILLRGLTVERWKG